MLGVKVSCYVADIPIRRHRAMIELTSEECNMTQSNEEGMQQSSEAASEGGSVRVYLHTCPVLPNGRYGYMQTVQFVSVQLACEQAAESIVGKVQEFGATCSMLGIGVDAQDIRHAIATPDLYANSDDPVDAVAVVLESVAMKSGYLLVEYASLRVEMMVVR